MARKHNTKHNRSTSRYSQRLAVRGLGKAPLMPALSELCKDHDHRAHEKKVAR